MSTEKSYNLHEVLQGIFAKLPDSYSFERDEKRIQEFFYRSQSSGNSVLQEIAFDKDGPYPSSGHLSQAFYSFLFTGLIKSISPSFNPCIISSDAMRIGFDRFCISHFSTPELGELETLAREFQKEFPPRKF